MVNSLHTRARFARVRAALPALTRKAGSFPARRTAGNPPQPTGNTRGSSAKRSSGLSVYATEEAVAPGCAWTTTKRGSKAACTTGPSCDDDDNDDDE